MRESRKYGSMRGAAHKGGPYRDLLNRTTASFYAQLAKTANKSASMLIDSCRSAKYSDAAGSG